jgi:hypothetical protein
VKIEIEVAAPARFVGVKPVAHARTQHRRDAAERKCRKQDRARTAQREAASNALFREGTYRRTTPPGDA